MRTRPKNLVASVLGRLRNQAQTEGVPFNQVLQFYAIERFLHRLSRSAHADSVLLKGALLLKTIGIPRARPTMDIDLLRQGNADRTSLIALVRDCALIEDESDAVYSTRTVSPRRTSPRKQPTPGRVCGSAVVSETCV